MRTFRYLSIVVLMIGGFLTTSETRADDFSVTASELVSTLADDAISSLTGADISEDQRIENFRGILLENFDVPAIARWVLGRNWRRASEEQRSEYLELFEDLIVVTYANRFKEYTGEKLEVVDAVAKNDRDAIVRTKLVRPNGGPEIPLDWRVKAGKSGNAKIVDIVVQGVSMSQTQRSEFASVIKNNGGLDGLIEGLRNKTAALSAYR